MHDEVATHDFMDELRVLVKSGSDLVKEQILSMVQTWNQTLGKKSNYRVIQDTYNVLRAEGYTFPQLNESEAMYLAETAPEWAEGDVCHQCRVKFSTFTRQHHCRCCGQVFCAKCSAKNSIIPKYGIEREVRVCDTCYDSINPAGASSKKKSTGSGETQSLDGDDLPAEYLNSSLAKEVQTKPKATESEIKAQEEEELQLAMALSLSAAESEKQQQPKRTLVGSGNQDPIYSAPASSPYAFVEPKSSLYSDVVTDSKRVSEPSETELSHYLDRDYWQKRKEGRPTEPSAPVVHEVEVLPRGPTYRAVEAEPIADENVENSDAFVKTISQSIDMFINRMQTVQLKGKHVAMDSTVQSLFQSLSAMHPQLMKLIEDEEDNKAKYEAMLGKIALIREGRESLDSMRNQHREKLHQQELEQEMLRRMQMEQKLELMRQQKQEYLEYQRQLQIQRQLEIEQQQQFKAQQQQQFQFQNAPQFATAGYQPPVVSQYVPVPAVDGYQTVAMSVAPAMPPAQMPPAQMQYAATAQYPQSSNGYDPRLQSEEGPAISQRQQPQFQPVSVAQSQMDQSGYRGQFQASVSQQPRQAPHPQEQIPGTRVASSPPQPSGYPAQVPDILDAPIGSELSAKQRDAQQQQQGYGNQLYKPPQQGNYPAQPGQEYAVSQQQLQQQQYVLSQQQQQPQPQYSQSQQQKYPQAQQQQSQQQQQYPQPQQQQQQYAQPQQQQTPPQQPQQPPFQSLPRNQLPQQPASGPYQTPVQQPPYSQATVSATQPPYSNQPSQQMYQQHQAIPGAQESQYHGQQPQAGNIPTQYAQMQVPPPQQGPSSLPYAGQQPNPAGGPGPASLPASLNQHPNPQAFVSEAGYAQNTQQGGYMHPHQQQAAANQEAQLTANMKDLQLISFE